MTNSTYIFYGPQLPISLSVEPLTEQTMTPYQYTYQNPIKYVDPDGKAPQDIIVLNVDGSIRKVYNDGSPHITIIDPNYKGRFTLSSYSTNRGLIYWNNRNRQIVANIAAYYGQLIGVSGVGATSKGKGMAHFDPSDNGIWILPQSNGSPSSQLNNKYNMQNVLIHENFHKKNEKDGINETFLTHAQVVLKASEHSTFKNTTTDYKEGQIGYISQLLMNAYYQNKEKEDVQSVIDHFNNLNTGYKLKFYRNDQTIYITTPQGDYKHIKYKRSNSSPNLD